MTGSTAQDGHETSIAVLGTGRIGGPIAGRLRAAGFRVAVWNRTAARAERRALEGALPAGAPAEAAASSRLILTMLADDDVASVIAEATRSDPRST